MSECARSESASPRSARRVGRGREVQRTQATEFAWTPRRLGAGAGGGNELKRCTRPHTKQTRPLRLAKPEPSNKRTRSCRSCADLGLGLSSMPPSCQRRRCLTHGAESPPPIPSQHATLPVGSSRFRAAQIPRNHVKRRPRRPSSRPAPSPPLPLLRSALLSDLLPLEVQPHLLLLLRVRVRVRARAWAMASARARVRARVRVRDRVRDSVRVRDRVTSSVSLAGSLELGVLGRAADCGVAAAGAASSTLELGVPQSAL